MKNKMFLQTISINYIDLLTECYKIKLKFMLYT